MNRIIILLFFVSFLRAQDADTIHFRNSTVLAAKVHEITPDLVRYKKLDNLEGPMYSSLKSDIRFIRFSSGRIQDIEGTPAPPPNLPSSDPYTGQQSLGMYEKGKVDAVRFYTHPGGSIGTGIAACGCGILGLIPALICSSSTPKPQNLHYPSEAYWNNPDYRAGYLFQAKKLKRKRVWTGFGIGLATGIAAAVILTNQ